jgi:hypothetical protein
VAASYEIPRLLVAYPQVDRHESQRTVPLLRLDRLARLHTIDHPDYRQFLVKHQSIDASPHVINILENNRFPAIRR